MVARGVAEVPVPSWWARQAPAKQHGICLLLLLVLAVSYFAPTLFTDKTVIGGDIVSWRALAESMLDYREETGEEALWSTNAFAGMPGYLIKYEKQVPQLDTIANLLRPVSWPALHFFILLVGTYLLVFYLTRDKLAGLLAAVAFGLTTYLSLLLIAGHNAKFIALCFAPWLVLAFAYTLRQPHLLGSLFFAITLAAGLRTDHVQIVYYTLFVLGVWWLVEGVGALRHGRTKTFGAATVWLLLGGVLGLLMVAHPYLSTFEYKAFTIRGAVSGGEAGSGALAWEYAMGWSQGFGELVTLLIADAYGGGGQLYWGPKPFTAGPHYVGGIVLLLAALALWRTGRNVVWGLGIAAFLMILFALGEHFATFNRLFFDYFPLFDAFRVPETWLSTVAFVLAVLAGFGLWFVARPEESVEAEATKTRRIYVALCVAAGITVLLFMGKDVFFDFERPGERALATQQIAQANGVSPDDPRVAQAVSQYFAEASDQRAEAFADDALRTILFLLLSGGVLWAFRQGKIPAWVMQLALALLIVVDLWGVDRRYFNSDSLQRVQDPEDLIAKYDFDDFILERQAEMGGPGHFRVLSLETDNPMINARPSYFYESIGGYHGAKLRLFQDFVENVLFDPRTGGINANALDLLNVRYIIAPGRLPDAEPLFVGSIGERPMAVLENPDAVPRAFFVGETSVVEAPEATWALLRSDEFDPRQTALLAAPLDFSPAPLDSASTAEVTLIRYGPREIAWQVQTDAPRLLVASEVYYPAGWTATVDGESSPIVRANYLLRAVPVPAGSHEVVMRFEPASYRIGLWIAGVTTFLVYLGALVLIFKRWRRRQQLEVALSA